MKTRICGVCGKEFPQKGKRLYCTPACSRLKMEQQLKELAERRRNGRPVVSMAVCAACGVPFKRKAGNQIYCGYECATRQLEPSQAKQWIEKMQNTEDGAILLVYAVSDGEYVKLGKSWSNILLRRMDTLQVANPRALTLLGVTTHLTETEIHQLLWPHRQRGEWFKICREVLEVIQRFTHVLDDEEIHHLMKTATPTGEHPS